MVRTGPVVRGSNRAVVVVAKTFLDTNILVYANDRADRDKQERALSVVERHLREGTGVISTQVLMEYTAVAAVKLGQVRAAVARQTVILERFEVVSVTGQVIRNGHELAEDFQISFWDGVILAAAMAARCDYLVSEDFSEGRSYGGVTVFNPFVA